MRRLLTGILALIVLLVGAPPAGAVTGNGLYQPFPGKASTARAKRYLERLPPGVPASLRRLNEKALDRGVFVRGAGSLQGRVSGPSQRGGVAAQPADELPLVVQLGLLALALAAGVAVIRLAPRRPRSN